MIVSVKGEYALQAILDLAIQNTVEPTKIADIARRQHIPQKFLELILASLKQGGFVASKRGAEGGYMLAKPAESITVGEVVRFVEGGKAPRAAREPHHPLSDLWGKVDDAISSVIDRATFAELARDWKEKRAHYVPNWEM